MSFETKITKVHQPKVKKKKKNKYLKENKEIKTNTKVQEGKTWDQKQNEDKDTHPTQIIRVSFYSIPSCLKIILQIEQSIGNKISEYRIID